MKKFRQLGLEQHVTNLETDGFTVIPPETVNEPDLVERMVEATKRVEAVRPPNTINQKYGDGTTGKITFDMLEEDRCFEEAVQARVPLALVTYLLGFHAKLGIILAVTKPPGTPPLNVHSDARCRFPEPWPTYAQNANVTWLLSDYSRGRRCAVSGAGKPPLWSWTDNRRVAR